MSDALRAITSWENQVIQHKNIHGTSPLDDEGLKKFTLLDILPTKEAEELESQLHLFKTYSDLKTRIEHLVISRCGSKVAKINNLEPDANSDLNVVEFTDAEGVLQRLEKKNGRWGLLRNPKSQLRRVWPRGNASGVTGRHTELLIAMKPII